MNSRKLLAPLFVALAFAFSSPAFAVYAHVQTTFFSTAAGSAITLTPTAGTPTGANFTTGSRVFAVIEYFQNGGDPARTVVSVTNQSAVGITYAEPVTQRFSTDGTGILIVDIPVMPASVTGIIITMSGSPAFGSAGAISEYTGLGTGAAQGGSSTAGSVGTGTDAVTSGTFSATAQPAIVWGFCTDSDFLSTPVTGTGFTSRLGSNGMRIEDLRITATGSQAATCTNNHGSASVHIAYVIVVGEPGAGGAGTVVNPINGIGGGAARPVTFNRRAANDDVFLLRASR